MPNILAISPISIAGSLIIKGLQEGFEQLGNNTLLCDVRKITSELIKSFNPDLIIGYDYAHFVIPEVERIISQLNIPVIHYFADDPNSNFAHSGDLELYNKLSNSKGIVFCWDKQYLNSFKNKAFYLPLGINPGLYAVSNNYDNQPLDIVFAGRPLTPIRQVILSNIVKNFPGKLSIYSFKKHFDTSVEEMEKQGLLEDYLLKVYKDSYKGFLEKEEELAQIYANSKIVLNITMDQGLSSMNYRVLEVLASGGFLLTDYKQDTVDYFTPDQELACYRDCNDIINKINQYLNNSSLRAQIAQNGKNKVIRYHTFKQRARAILDLLSN